MMRMYGQFNVPSNNRIEVEFPCPNCGNAIKETLKIKPEQHSDEEVSCPECNFGVNVIVIHDAGSGCVNVPALGKDQANVMAFAKKEI